MISILFSGRMLLAFFMGFYSGLPLLMTGGLLQAWMKEEGLDLTTIGLFALVGLPYTLKFLWAPVFDRFSLPLLGRRRGWLFVTQALTTCGIAAFATLSPAHSLSSVALAALALCYFSASQDTVIDAYRRERLSDLEQGLGASYYVNGYRVGTLLASGGGLILADFLSFREVYLVMAGIFLTSLIVTVVAREPAAPARLPQNWREAVIHPLVQFLQRADSWWILLFVLLYKLGDSIASQMTTPFYLDIGFSKTEVGSIVKLFGFWATFFGGLAGGMLILRLGVFTTLVQFGVLQALSTAAFAALTYTGPNLIVLSVVITFENLSAGMGTASFLAFMANQTDKRFTATQYALLSSVMGVPRVLMSAPSGWLADTLGWTSFFVACALIATPGLLVLLRFRGWMTSPTPVTLQSEIPPRVNGKRHPKRD